LACFRLFIDDDDDEGFYSSYKGKTTLKCPIGVTPSGAISFTSGLYVG